MKPHHLETSEPALDTIGWTPLARLQQLRGTG